MRKHNSRQLRVLIPDAKHWDDESMVEKNQVLGGVASISRTLRYLTLLASIGLVALLYSIYWERVESVNDVGEHAKPAVWTWNGDRFGDNEGATTDSGDVLDACSVATSTEALIVEAKRKHAKLLGRETRTLNEAAATYRTRRGRHPPPHFDRWYAYAAAHNSVIVEEFWDQIYDDLGPFWSIEPLLLRKQANVFSNKISIRNSKIESKSYNLYPKLAMWTDMLATLASQPGVALPNLDIPVNVNDEPGILVPWEVIDTAVSLSRKIQIPLENVIREFSEPDNIENLTTSFKFDPEWLGPRLAHPESHLGPRPLWSLVRPACPPDSPSRLGHVYNDIWEPGGEAHESHTAIALFPDTFNGPAKNWTKVVDACQNPHLQGLQSAFVAPKQMSVSTKLFPLFGDSKFSMSNDILLPGSIEWNVSSTSSGLEVVPWDQKQNKLYWRGDITKSHNPTRYWRRFERERFVSMLNATQIEAANVKNAKVIGPAENFAVHINDAVGFDDRMTEQVANQVRTWADVAFSCRACNDETSCSHLQEYFAFSDTDLYDAKHKYAMALDGSGGDDAGELTEYLKDGRLALRASVYRKWYESRLVPWLHFVPISNTFEDVYAIMKYFLGTGTKNVIHPPTPVHEQETPSIESKSPNQGNEPHRFAHQPIEPPLRSRDLAGHDDVARQMAEAAQQWAGKVLRREDMLIYVYRLLLEYARAVDDKRERLGWVDDLLEAIA